MALLDVPSGMAAARADKQMDRSSRPKSIRGPRARFRIRCSTRAEDPKRPRVWFCAGRSVAPRSKLRVRLSVFREAVPFVANPVEGSLSPMITAGVPRLGLRQDEALRLGLRGEKEEVCRLVRVDQAGLVEETGKESRRARPGVVDLSLEPLPPGPGAGAWREAPTRSSLRRRAEGKGASPWPDVQSRGRAELQGRSRARGWDFRPVPAGTRGDSPRTRGRRSAAGRRSGGTPPWLVSTALSRRCSDRRKPRRPLRLSSLEVARLAAGSAGTRQVPVVGVDVRDAVAQSRRQCDEPQRERGVAVQDVEIPERPRRSAVVGEGDA